MRRSTATNEPARLFVDTWGWLVLEDSKDPAHPAVQSLRVQSVESGTMWVTTDFVLDETITRLFSRRPFAEARRYCDGIFRSIDTGVLALERVTPERFASAYRLRLRYSEKLRISFTDLTSFVVMTELGIHDVLTEDVHFTQIRLGFRLFP
jgi:predicted nucleic acid-binding protein